MRLLSLGVLLLCGCAAVETDMLASQGVIRVEPHPDGSGAMRANIVTTAPSTRPFRFAETSTDEGRRHALALYLGGACRTPAMTEEGRIRLSPVLGEPREQITYRVTCP